MARRLTPLERLRQSGARPDRQLGQNFLIDANILDVIERTAALGPEDVVLEVGPGVGVLTERLLERCALVHAVELDPRLAAVLEDEFADRPNFRLYRADAMRFPLAGLDPPPGKFVANLPYNVATPLVMRSLEGLPTVMLWCLMLQKEIADRLFALPGAANYGGASVMVQLFTRKLASRGVAGTVFYPRPRVSSSLLAFKRRPAAGYASSHFPQVKALVYGAFAHRRKILVNSLAEAGAGTLPEPLGRLDMSSRRKRVAELLGQAGLPLRARPQDLSPPDYERLAELLAADAHV